MGVRTAEQSAGVLCVGRLYCDLVFTGLERMPTLGREVFAEGLSVSPGGGAYITAAYLAALGREARLSAVLPAGPFGQAIQAELVRSGVDLAGLSQCAEGQGPQLTVAMATGGDRAFLTRRVGPSVPVDFDTALAAPGLSHLHIGELATLLDHRDLPERARERGLTVSLDCSGDEVAIAHPDALDLINKTDLFLPNIVEVAGLFKWAEADIDGLLPQLATLTPLVAVKRGSAGAFALADGQPVEARAEPCTVVDSTGAGDAFDAGFIDAWLRGEPLEQCLARGTQCGAIAVGRAGGASDLTAISQRQEMAEQV